MNSRSWSRGASSEPLCSAPAGRAQGGRGRPSCWTKVTGQPEHPGDRAGALLRQEEQDGETQTTRERLWPSKVCVSRAYVRTYVQKVQRLYAVRGRNTPCRVPLARSWEPRPGLGCSRGQCRGCSVGTPKSPLSKWKHTEARAAGPCSPTVPVVTCTRHVTSVAGIRSFLTVHLCYCCVFRPVASSRLPRGVAE